MRADCVVYQWCHPNSGLRHRLEACASCRLNTEVFSFFSLHTLQFHLVSSVMHFISTFSLCLIGVLAISLSNSVEAATNVCQMCVNDVAKTIPQCKGVDGFRSNPKTFSDYSSAEQACLCAVGHDASPFMKCDPLCPPGNMEQVALDSAALAAIYCKPDGSGPLGSTSGSTSGSSAPSSHFVSAAAAAIVLSAAALV